MNLWILIKLVDQSQEHLLAGISRQAEAPGQEPRLLTRLDLTAHVNFRSSVLTHQNDSQARTHPALLGTRTHHPCNVAAQLRRDFFTVDDCGCMHFDLPRSRSSDQESNKFRPKALSPLPRIQPSAQPGLRARGFSDHSCHRPVQGFGPPESELEGSWPACARPQPDQGAC